MPAKPLYQRIIEYYAARIRAGELKAGDMLPTQRELMEAWECSVSPVRMAIRELEHMGLIESFQGLGAKVLPQAPPARKAR